MAKKEQILFYSCSFFPCLIFSCRKNMVMKTRMMSARAVVPLVTGDSLIKTLQKLLQSLPAR